MTVDVPEDFDLDAALAAHSTTPTDERKRCPECGRATVHTKSPTGRSRRSEHPEDHYCKSYGAHFDEPLVGAGVGEA